MFHERIIDTKKVAAGLCFTNGDVRFGKSVLDWLKDTKRLRQKIDDGK